MLYSTDKKKIIYVGETANLKDRMKDLGRTYNHTLRRSIGQEIIGKKVTNKDKYTDEEEKRINEYFQKNIKLSFIIIPFGRKELEEQIIKNYNPIYNKPKKR